MTDEGVRGSAARADRPPPSTRHPPPSPARPRRHLRPWACARGLGYRPLPGSGRSVTRLEECIPPRARKESTECGRGCRTRRRGVSRTWALLRSDAANVRVGGRRKNILAVGVRHAERRLLESADSGTITATRLIQAQSRHPGGPDNLRYPLGAPPAASARFWGRLVGDSLRLRPDVLERPSGYPGASLPRRFLLR